MKFSSNIQVIQAQFDGPELKPIYAHGVEDAGCDLKDIDKAIDCLRKLRKEIEPCVKSQMKADRIVAGSQAAEPKRDITLEERM